MLQENQSYMMKIIFDDLEYILPLVSGQNPKFSFDQIITKQLQYDQLEKKYMEIILYSLPSSVDLYSLGGQKDKLLEQANVYSSYKISLLTIVVGPEFHNLVLTCPWKKNVHLGRVMYIITCKQIANINIKINNVKIYLDNLLNNDIALKLKYHDNKTNPNSTYTSGIAPNIIQKEKITEYNYKPNLEDNNPLNIYIKTSMYDLTLADSSLNAYTIRLISKPEEVNTTNSIFKNNTDLNANNNDANIQLINHYTMIGFSNLSFLDILSENDEALNKQSSQFFRHVSGFNMPKEDEKEENNVQVFTFQVFQDYLPRLTSELFYQNNHRYTLYFQLYVQDFFQLFLLNHYNKLELAASYFS